MAHVSYQPLHIASGIPAYGSRMVGRKPNRSKEQVEVQTRQRAWLGEVLTTTKLKPSQLADQAGVSDTTLTRLLNNPEYKGTLSQITIDRIKETFNVPGPEEYASSRRAVFGFSEAERLDVRRLVQQELGRIVTAILHGRQHVEPWRLRTSALEMAGYLPGDVVFVDHGAEARPHDAVCAQVTDFNRGAAETIWRLFDPPFLVAASHERAAYKPLLIDNERVQVRGVIVDSYRPAKDAAR